jgi:hypothetical protein
MRLTHLLFALGAVAIATPLGLALRAPEFRSEVHALADQVESQVFGYTRLDAPR